MPIFEYRCEDCSKKFSALVGMTADSAEPQCPKCRSSNIRKLISRFQRVRNEDEKFDAMEDAALRSSDDPAAMSKLMREMGKDLAEDGEDIDEYLDEAERDFYDGADDSD